MSYHTYDKYYIDIPHENIINPFSMISNNEIHPIEFLNGNHASRQQYPLQNCYFKPYFG
jgi:hypothetical protein